MIKKPIIIVSISYIIGILWGIYVKSISLFLCINFIIILISIFIRNAKRNITCRFIKSKVSKSTLTLLLIFIAIGYINVSCFEGEYEKMYSEEKLVVMIISEGKEGEYYNTYLAKAKEYNINVYLKVDKNITFNYGDYIEVNEKVEKPDGERNRYGFNYKQYLKSINIAGSIKFDKNFKIKENRKQSIGRSIYNLRESIREHIYSIAKTKNKFIVEALLLGDKENLEEEIKESFRISGVSHLLTISGTHIAIISLVFRNILKCARGGKKFNQISIIVILLLYIFIAGGTPSVVRACITSILALTSKLIHRKSDLYSNLSLSSFIILLINPYSILNLSFILSYAGIFGIIVYDIIQNKYLVQLNKKYLIEKFKGFRVIKHLISYIISSFIVSICIQIITIPILINNFHSISLIGFIVNICATPILSAVINISLITIIISYICMPVAVIMGNVVNFLVDFFMNIVDVGANMPFTEVLCTRISTITVVSYYAMLVYIVYLIKIDRVHIIKHLVKKNTIRLVVLVLITIITINIYNFIRLNPVEIDFIDVGQGDATLIKTPSNKSILIDGGGRQIKESTRNKKRI